MKITVTATRWARGWELTIGTDQHTQVVTLDRAVQQIRDYLDSTDPAVDHSGWDIDIAIPELGDIATKVTQAQQATEAAAAATRQAARQSREAVRQLRDAGYSVTDSAAILGVSRGRVSQLAND